MHFTFFIPYHNTRIQIQSMYAESLKCAITMLFLFIVLCVHVRVCVCAWARACVGFCAFMFGLHCYWLDCSHPPIHPIATIATDGAAGINAPGSASLINGRLMKPLISDLSLLWLLGPSSLSIFQPPLSWVLTFYMCSQLCQTLLYPYCPSMSFSPVEFSLDLFLSFDRLCISMLSYTQLVVSVITEGGKYVFFQ